LVFQNVKQLINVYLIHRKFNFLKYKFQTYDKFNLLVVDQHSLDLDRVARCLTSEIMHINNLLLFSAVKFIIFYQNAYQIF
jgi:hypothetical protein